MPRLSPTRTLVILLVIGCLLLLFIISQFNFKSESGSGSKFKLDLPPLPPKVNALQFESDLAMHQSYLNMQEKFSLDALEQLKYIAVYYMKSGRTEQAIQVLTTIYKAQSHMFGPQENETVETLDLLARQNVKLKKNDEALSLFWRVYKIQEKTLGPTHSETLTTLQNLAQVYSFKGNYEKAVGFFKVVYKQRKLLLGPEHVETMEVLYLLGNSLLKTEKHETQVETVEKVLKYYGQVYKVYSRTWGENEKSLTVLSEIGKFLVALKRLEEAIPIFQTVMKATEKTPHPELLETAENLLALSLAQLGRTEEARQVHLKAHQIKNKSHKYAPLMTIHDHGKFTPEVEDEISAALNLARVAMAEQNFEQALQKLEHVYSVIKKDHPRAQEILQQIISVHGALRNVKKGFEMSVELFHVVQKHSDQNKNEQIAHAWQIVFSSYLKLREEHPDDEIEKYFSPKCKEISEIALKTLGIKEIDENNPNPTILRTLAIAGFLCAKPEIAVPAASKLIPILERQRDAEPKPSQEEIEKLDKEIKVFQNQLEEHQSCGPGKYFEIQNDMHRNEL